MGKDKEIFKVALEEVRKLGLDSYHELFLSRMVELKVKHPTRKVDKIAEEVMADFRKVYAKYHKLRPDLYPKRNIISTSKRRTIERLEEVLERIENVEKFIPNEDAQDDEIVSNVVKIISAEVLKKL